MAMMTSNIAAGLRRVGSRDMLVLPDTAGDVISKLAQFETHDPAKVAAMEATSRESLALAYGYCDGDEGDRKPFVFQDGIAVIPVHGALINRFNGSWGFVTGYNYIRRMMNLALEDDDVDLIVYDVDSPGGEAAGCFELAREIMMSRKIKPSLAMVDSLCASGGIAIGVAPSKIYAIPSARVGSIGVYRMHVSYEKALDNDGIKVTFATAGEHKIDGSPYKDLPQAVLDEWTQEAGKTWDDFISLVAEARDLGEADVRATQARIYRADEALALGLIDAVKTPTEAVAAFLAELADDEPLEDDEEDVNMTEKTKGSEVTSGLTAEAVQTMIQTAMVGVLTTVQRSQEIKDYAASKNQVALGSKLAGNPAISLEDAKGMIDAASPAVAAPKKAPAGKGQRAGEPGEDDDDDADADDADDADDDADADDAEDEDDGEKSAAPRRGKQKVGARRNRDNVNHFDRAMTNSRHPGVGAGKGKGGDDDGEKGPTSASILADHAAVTGATWGTKSKRAANQ